MSTRTFSPAVAPERPDTLHGGVPGDDRLRVHQMQLAAVRASVLRCDRRVKPTHRRWA